MQQAQWTSDLRRYLFQLTGLEEAGRVLEVGCGTGAVLATLARLPRTQLVGIDIDAARLGQAAQNVPLASPAQSDAHFLPFASASFDIVYCHFLLLWVSNPTVALAEMERVVRPGGWVLALAEPDYGGRVDFPEALAQVGQLQEQALKAQGADPRLGRRLGALFLAAGLQDVRLGVLGGQWRPAGAAESDWRQEWQVLEADLGDRLNKNDLHSLYQIEADARRSGERLLFVPTFYAMGRK